MPSHSDFRFKKIDRISHPEKNHSFNEDRKNLFRDMHVFECTSIHPAKARMLKILYMFNVATHAFSLRASEWLSHMVTYDTTKHEALSSRISKTRIIPEKMA